MITVIAITAGIAAFEAIVYRYGAEDRPGFDERLPNDRRSAL